MIAVLRAKSKGGKLFNIIESLMHNVVCCEQFTGLQLLCMTYVGFQKIEPAMDTGLEFKEAYTQALDAYKARFH